VSHYSLIHLSSPNIFHSLTLSGRQHTAMIISLLVSQLLVLCTYVARTSADVVEVETQLSGSAATESFGKTTSIRGEFLQNFQQSCSKYDFVQDYIARLEQPVHNDKFLLFMYHTKTLKNGGFGDRMGGMITAFAQAMRFNRTLILLASNGMQDLFRPYHPTDIFLPIEEQQFTWKQWRTWSGFDAWKASLEVPYDSTSNSSRSLYEYDLSNCVSNQESGFTEEETAHCAMDTTYTDKPILRLASNRAYLCRWEKHPELPAHKEVYSALKLAPKKTDLFEVAGCMLRLLMWPTERMWEEADKGYNILLGELKSSMLANVTATSPASLAAKEQAASNNKEAVEEEDEQEEESEDAVEDKDEESSSKKKKKKNSSSKKKDKNKKQKKASKKKKDSKKKKSKSTPNESVGEDLSPQRKLTKREQKLLQQIDIYASNTTERVPFTLQEEAPMLFGLHFRCGDRWSYLKFKLHTDGHDANACVVEAPDSIGGDTGLDDGQKSQYHRAGNPASIGECAKHLVGYHNVVKATGKVKHFSSFLFIFKNCFVFFSYLVHPDQAKTSKVMAE
jgi:hypothetical protein